MFWNVMPWRSMNACMLFSLPFQATPTTEILSAHLMLAASTEGASRLHVLQPGAQNQNATGFPANEDTSKVEPPTRSAEISRMSATAAPALDVSGAGNDAAGLVLPHPLRVPDAATASIPATGSGADLFDNEVTRTTQAYRRCRVV